MMKKHARHGGHPGRACNWI